MRQLSVVGQAFTAEFPEINTVKISLYGQDVLFSILETDFDTDIALGSYDVLVKKEAFSINYRDLAIIMEAGGYFEKNISSLAHFPIGSDFVGVVTKIGPNVTSVKIGDRVIPDSYLEYKKEKIYSGVPTNNGSKEYEVITESKLMPVPDLMPDSIAGGFTIGAQTSYSMIRRSKVGPKDSVLITSGSSNTSLFILNGLKKIGCLVSILTTDSEKMQKLYDLGADYVFLVDPDLLVIEQAELLKQLHTGRKFNVVFDPFFDLYFSQLLPFVAPYGRYISCGFQKQHPNMVTTPSYRIRNSIDACEMIARVMQNNVSILGNCLGNSDDLKSAVEDYNEGRLVVAVDSTYNEDEMDQFLNRSFFGKMKFGKVVLKYQENN